MITQVKISDMREIALVDLDQISPDQGLTLATAVADVLIRSGTTRDDVPLSGPHLLQFLSELGDLLAAQRAAADSTDRDDAFEEAIAGLYSFDTDKDRDRAKEAVGVARLRLMNSHANANPDTVYVLNHEPDGEGREAIAIYESRLAAVDDILQTTENDARKAGLRFDDELRAKIRSHIIRFGKFEGLKSRSYQEEDLVALQEALGWNSYYIEEWSVRKSSLTPDRIQITGSMQLESSKRGLRYMTVYASHPYDHEVKLTIEVTPEQDDNILSERLYDLTGVNVKIAARLVDGDLVCTTNDITPA
jgi:hypothetical protein